MGGLDKIPAVHVGGPNGGISTMDRQVVSPAMRRSKQYSKRFILPLSYIIFSATGQFWGKTTGLQPFDCKGLSRAAFATCLKNLRLR